MGTTLAQAALQIAATQIYVQEVPKGSNAGPQVEKYLKSVGLGKGYSWCEAFVYWCVNEAARNLGLVNPLVKTGGVLNQYNTCTLRKLPNRSNAVKPGDIFIMDFGGGNGHTGFVESVGSGVITTIEGNTNNDGSREGYEVCKRTRPLSAIKGFIQLN
ncbi:CHAP domain-containing protein [Pinibacter soli]|uniref:CHAP domain-containing protein n=1 Tax=Pinibacter soli TaxID=3044211 RepID=A0ABT6R989_9BACT|nr:CHAP domain-containing protein [Pinibacter soli]MDI3319122.1 CHAP domain-containing protein [Pinibacter soli]